MAANGESETKKIINPRVEIDTSPPFESVKEAVDHFGGSGPWIPHHLLRLPPPDNETRVVDMGKMEEQAVKFEKDLIVKEQEALNVLREVEAAKRFVEGLKVNLMQEVSEYVSSPGLNSERQTPTPTEQSAETLSLCALQSPGHVLMELNQAKLDLNKMSIDLTVIRSSVETLNKKMKKEKVLLDRSSQMKSLNSTSGFSIEENNTNSGGNPDVHILDNSMNKELQQLSFEADQFKKMAEASRYEVMKAMSEIERTKASIRMAEMRLHAAKKMEEAAKAVEAIAFAERKALLNGNNSSAVVQHNPEGITIPYEEYYALSRKAQQAEELCKTKFVDTSTVLRTSEAKQCDKVSITKRMEEAATEIRHDRSTLEEALDNEDGTQKRSLIEQDGFYGERSEHTQLHYSGHDSGEFKLRTSQSSQISHGNPQLVDDNEPDKVNKRPVPLFRSSISIGDILSRKLILRDDHIVVGKHMETSHTERQHVSFSQMLREQSGIILNPTKAMKDGSVHKQYITHKKKFGFIQVPIPKQNKKKTQPLNVR